VSECEPNHIMLKLDHQNLVCSQQCDDTPREILQVDDVN
jgi:hypothetical protein